MEPIQENRIGEGQTYRVPTRDGTVRWLATPWLHQSQNYLATFVGAGWPVAITSQACKLARFGWHQQKFRKGFNPKVLVRNESD